MAAVVIMTAVAAARGEADAPRIESMTVDPVITAEDQEPEEAEPEEADEADKADTPELEAEHTEASLAAQEAAARSAESAGRGRMIQGRAAVDPRATGTVVAHAVAAEIVAYRSPTTKALVVESFENPTDRGGPLVFAGIGQPINGWLEVLLPVRPNGTTGWIQVADVDLSVNPYRIEVDASAYRLTIFRYGREEMSTTVAIGNGATPTPLGDFFLIELLRPSDPGGVYGPFAYGLSGYSETLDSFNGGEGIIGIHGTNQPELLGQDVSHGCIRIANPTIAEMTEFLPLGTPVSIFRSADQADAEGEAGTDGESEENSGGRSDLLT